MRGMRIKTLASDLRANDLHTLLVLSVLLSTLRGAGTCVSRPFTLFIYPTIVLLCSPPRPAGWARLKQHRACLVQKQKPDVTETFSSVFRVLCGSQHTHKHTNTRGTAAILWYLMLFKWRSAVRVTVSWRMTRCSSQANQSCM